MKNCKYSFFIILLFLAWYQDVLGEESIFTRAAHSMRNLNLSFTKKGNKAEDIAMKSNEIICCAGQIVQGVHAGQTKLEITRQVAKNVMFMYVPEILETCNLNPLSNIKKTYTGTAAQAVVSTGFAILKWKGMLSPVMAFVNYGMPDYSFAFEYGLYAAVYGLFVAAELYKNDQASKLPVSHTA